jgi:hypothetical protein
MPINAVQHIVYSNHRIEAPDGTLICRAGEERTNWYLERGLAEIVEGFDPFTIRLTFEPAGRGNVGDEFYLSDKLNCCVVCGNEEGFNQHHVVPRCYRRHFPQNYKDRASHDVLILCLDCHVAYEKEADKLKALIGEELGFSFIQKSEKAMKESPSDMARYAARVLLVNRSQMPQERILALEATVRQATEQEPTQEVLEGLAGTMVMEQDKMVRRRAQQFAFQQYAQHVVSQINLDSLVYRWRQHFIDTMNPRFLPNGWSVDNPTCTS